MTLPFRTRIIVDEILAQLKSRSETLRGIEATIIEKELTYRRGQFVVKKTTQESRTLSREQNLDDEDGLLELLANPKYHLKELRSGKQNELRIHLQPVAPKKLDFKNSSMEDSIAVTLFLQQAPVQLLRMEAELVNVPWWFKWVIKSLDNGVEFEYVRGIPAPKCSFMRTLSRGIGSWRWGTGQEIEFLYENV